MQLSSDIYRRIVSAKVFIDVNYHSPIDLEQVSRQAFLSRFHFHRLFKRVYQQTPHQYISRKRLDRAKSLLAENRPVNEVCHEVGFESMASFSLFFKKQTGFPPTDYRNMAWLQKQLQKSQPKKCIPYCFIDQYKLDKESNNQ